MRPPPQRNFGQRQCRAILQRRVLSDYLIFNLKKQKNKNEMTRRPFSMLKIATPFKEYI
jgi:hypothetical protein